MKHYPIVDTEGHWLWKGRLNSAGTPIVVLDSGRVASAGILVIQAYLSAPLPAHYHPHTCSLCTTPTCVRHTILKIASRAYRKTYRALGVYPLTAVRLRKRLLSEGIAGGLAGRWWGPDLERPDWGIPREVVAYIAQQEGVPRAAVMAAFHQILWRKINERRKAL